MDSHLIGSLQDVMSRVMRKPHKEALTWLSDKVEVLKQGPKDRIASSRFPKDTTQTFMSTRMNVTSVGRMIMFAYDPKTKAKLPYYDILPLILLVDADGHGFYGLNLHYVPPLLRRAIIASLKDSLNDGQISTGRAAQGRAAKMSYATLKKASNFPVLKQCFKRYLFSNVRSSFLYVAPSEWERSVMLPTERFVKATKQKVFKESVAASMQGTVKSNKPTPAQKSADVPDVRTTAFFRRS